MSEQSAFDQGGMLTEAPNEPSWATLDSGVLAAAGPAAGFDPVLISLIRRSMPNLVAYDLAGVQPMIGPTGLIFAMRSRKTRQAGNETFFDEVDSAFSGQTAGLNNRNGSPTLLLVLVLLLSLVLILVS